MKRLLLAVLILAPVCLLLAQHPQNMPTETSRQASHHAYLDLERQALERGEGFGMAMAADRAGYPGPKHALELKSELNLTDAQVAAMEKLFAEMKSKAVERGREVLAAEERLGHLFHQGRPAEELRQEIFRIATLRAEVRWVHLNTHLEAKKVLNPQQLAKYTQLRYPKGEQQHVH